MKRAVPKPIPPMDLESDKVLQLLNGVNQQPHYSREFIMSDKAKRSIGLNSFTCKKGSTHLAKNGPSNISLFEHGKSKALKKIAEERTLAGEKNLRLTQEPTHATATQNLNRILPRTATRPTDASATLGSNEKKRQLLETNPIYNHRVDDLAASMTCIKFKKIVRPGFMFRCIDGHVHCEKCKGGSLTIFGGLCTLCRDVYKKKHKIRPNKALPETNPHVREAANYIERCEKCPQEYYNMGNGKKEHWSRHIDETWGNLD
jgi:hypothetical protein